MPLSIDLHDDAEEVRNLIHNQVIKNIKLGTFQLTEDQSVYAWLLYLGNGRTIALAYNGSIYDSTQYDIIEK